MTCLKNYKAVISAEQIANKYLNVWELRACESGREGGEEKLYHFFYLHTKNMQVNVYV